MCDVPSIAVFCSESIECFPGTVIIIIIIIIIIQKQPDLLVNIGVFGSASIRRVICVFGCLFRPSVFAPVLCEFSSYCESQQSIVCLY